MQSGICDSGYFANATICWPGFRPYDLYQMPQEPYILKGQCSVANLTVGKLSITARMMQQQFMLFYDRTFDFKSILENMKVNIEFEIKK